MGFSVRLAPGVRIRASSRGIRASVGPRAARIHVGAGPPGVSTGAGPVGFYTSLSGSSGGRTPSRSSPAASVRGLQAASKAAEAQRIAVAIDTIGRLHRSEFRTYERPIAAPVAVQPLEDLRQAIGAYAVRDLNVFQRSKRAAARAWADREASAEHDRRVAAAIVERAAAQAALDAQWGELIANNPDVVMRTLADAFEDNEAPAAAVGVAGDELSLAVLVPDDTVVPDRIPALTAAGNLSLPKATKAQVSQIYMTLVSGHVLVTVKEALAVAVGIRSASVVVLRHRGMDSYGRPRLEWIMAVKIRRAALVGVLWAATDAPTVLVDVSDELLMNTRGTGRELVPLELADHPGVAALVRSINTDALLGRSMRSSG